MSWARIFNAALVVLVLAGLLACLSAYAEVPARADHYRRDLTRIAQQEMGLTAPVALFAAQIHQESSWRSDAKSPYAEGLTQFTPATAKWISEIYPDLGNATPYSPGWAMRAMVRYDLHILARVKPWHARDIPDCDKWAFTLSGYNGGPGWITRDRRHAENAGHCPDAWFGSVEKYSARSAPAFKENRHYVNRILNELTERYLSAGWQGAPLC
ncbi:MAG: transglycosylase SLT domain-containing protein [Zhongshania sp.]|uniref:transglycosylase SLT domain-containing protein n=1 Tax=Zhongshania sp. TaxID=1971902 RepID=UPI00260EAEDD|nr:transglycosylase SLT domain-containing protein [Zhongshania sp.]MDF1691754.1 transglycosylase SLT domain-containing protein [Zhongshania sp.]